MKKLWWSLLTAAGLFIQPANAQNMVTTEDYLSDELLYAGLPDYPPFSDYKVIEKSNGADITYNSAFLKPMQEMSKKYSFELVFPFLRKSDIDFKQLMLDIRSGKYQLFFGLYSNTKLFKGVELLYPATISNPIHIITLPDKKQKIKTSKDLAKMKGAISKTEYLSDFVIRKIKPLNLDYVESPNEAYEKLFTGKIDYILGGMYYNRIMASRYGVERYLSYSAKPIFKIPVFIGMSKLTPRFSLYKKALEEEFDNPEFSNAVKKEILRMVNEEVNKNSGIVPPTFVPKIQEELPAPEVVEEIKEDLGGQVIEKEIKKKTIEEILDGI